jgi:zinc/manganese transport system permease protein
VHWIVEPGLWANSSVRTALAVGAIVALVSSVVGVFTVLRGQSFAGHALTDVATAGGAGAVLAGVTPLLGFLGGGVVGAGVMESVGVERVRGRDVATGVVLGAAFGLSALFLYLSTSTSATSGTTQLILFGSIFTVSAATLPEVAVLSAAVLLVVASIARPLLLSSLSVELAAARATFVVLLAVSVGLSSIVIGSILSTALLIGPPASALKVVSRLGSAFVLAAVAGVAATLAGVVLAYDSYYWFASHRGLPVSFFVVVLVVAEFVVASVAQRVRRQRAARDRSNTTVNAAS